MKKIIIDFLNPITMSSSDGLREFVNERLTAAAEEIFRVFIKTVVEYEKEIDRQRRLLDIIWKPEIKLHPIGLYYCNNTVILRIVLLNFLMDGICTKAHKGSMVHSMVIYNTPGVGRKSPFNF